MSAGKGLQGSAAWAPLWLRLALGVTFIWAGLGKVLATAELPGWTRPQLVEMGAIAEQAAADRPGPTAADSEAGTEGDADSTALPKPAGEKGKNDGDAESKEAEAKPKEPDAATPPSPPSPPRAATDGGAASEEPVVVRRVWGLGLRVHHSAYPPERLGEAGRPVAIWPKFIGSAGWAAFWGWSVAACEVLLGVGVLVGLFTRVSALGLMGVMLGALWLDQIGPAVQSGATRLGFLPGHDIFEVKAWMPMLWQLSLLAGATAVLLLGAGRVSLDRLLFGPSSGDDDDEL